MTPESDAGAVSQMGGQVTYNGRTFKDFRVHRTAGYIEQEDVHMGELTVRETFDFAARCMGAGTKKGELGASQQASGTIAGSSKLWYSGQASPGFGTRCGSCRGCMCCVTNVASHAAAAMHLTCRPGTLLCPACQQACCQQEHTHGASRCMIWQCHAACAVQAVQPVMASPTWCMSAQVMG